MVKENVLRVFVVDLVKGVSVMIVVVCRLSLPVRISRTVGKELNFQEILLILQEEMGHL